MKTVDADRLVDMPKTIGELIRWKIQHERRQRYRFKVRVIAPEFEGNIFLTGNASPDSWGFVLLGPGNIRLRKISTPHPRHFHPDGTEADRCHKHSWTEDDDELWTYVPEGIRWENLNHALIDFVDECNIKLLSTPQELIFQSSIGLG